MAVKINTANPSEQWRILGDKGRCPPSCITVATTVKRKKMFVSDWRSNWAENPVFQS